ncbi:MAG: DMT family transporter [Proteobacteria bacterium]|nr:DMT family transporter [Pseudomonadota bacterium]
MKSYFYTSCAFIIWSSWVIPVRFLEVNTYTLSFYLCFFSSIIWGSYNLIRRKNLGLNGKEFFFLIILSSLFVGNLITYLLSLQLTSSSIAVLTHYTAPIFVALLAPIILKERVTKTTILALSIAFTGFLVIFVKADMSFTFDRGAFFGLLSGVFYGLSVITARKILKTLDSEILIFYQNTFSSIILLIFASKISFEFEPNFFIKMFMLSLLYSGIASYLYLYGLYRLGGVRTSIIGYFEPLGTMFWGWFIFSESLTIKIVVGGFLILFSGYIITRYDRIIID